jgi:hypothetical protein
MSTDWDDDGEGEYDEGKCDDFETLSKIGSGSFGTVYKGNIVNHYTDSL